MTSSPSVMTSPPLVMTSCVRASADELCELKEEKPVAWAQTLTAKERESVEEKEETLGGGEKGQREEEKEVTEEKVPPEMMGGAKDDEEEELEELRAQVFTLLLELDQTREDSQRQEESALELQGEY